MQRTASVAPICSQPSGLMRGSAAADGARTPTVISELTTAVATASAVVGMAAESLGGPAGPGGPAGEKKFHGVVPVRGGMAGVDASHRPYGASHVTQPHQPLPSQIADTEKFAARTSTESPPGDADNNIVFTHEENAPSPVTPRHRSRRLHRRRPTLTVPAANAWTIPDNDHIHPRPSKCDVYCRRLRSSKVLLH